MREGATYRLAGAVSAGNDVVGRSREAERGDSVMTSDESDGSRSPRASTFRSSSPRRDVRDRVTGLAVLRASPLARAIAYLSLALALSLELPVLRSRVLPLLTSALTRRPPVLPPAAIPATTRMTNSGPVAPEVDGGGSVPAHSGPLSAADCDSRSLSALHSRIHPLVDKIIGQRALRYFRASLGGVGDGRGDAGGVGGAERALLTGRLPLSSSPTKGGSRGRVHSLARGRHLQSRNVRRGGVLPPYGPLRRPGPGGGGFE